MEPPNQGSLPGVAIIIGNFSNINCDPRFGIINTIGIINPIGIIINPIGIIINTIGIIKSKLTPSEFFFL